MYINSGVIYVLYILGCPDPPTNVTLSISSSTSLLVKFGEPLNRNGAVVTKYKGKDICFTARLMRASKLSQHSTPCSLASLYFVHYTVLVEKFITPNTSTDEDLTEENFLHNFGNYQFCLIDYVT